MKMTIFNGMTVEGEPHELALFAGLMINCLTIAAKKQEQQEIDDEIKTIMKNGLIGKIKFGTVDEGSDDEE